ncbi:hypothetical protein GCM10017744_040410 [Streptomyces antimycoticus]
MEVLTVSRRSGAALLAATRRITGRMPLTRLPARAVRAHRELAAVRDGGRVEAYTYPTAGAELDNVADILRRAHLEDGVPWREMAVLVRAGGRSIPGVRRALTSAGVPVEVDGDDIPLRHEPAVAPLLTALRAAATAALPDSGGLSAVLGVETALTLLTSPLGGMDAADLRRLGRALREEERSAGRAVPRPSDVLLAEALAEPERLAVHDPAYARGAQRLGLLLRTAREALARGGTAEQALWQLWDGTSWPGRLERAAQRGGTAGRNADRDLDAVCALFETAARAEERTGGRGALNFLEEIDAQDIAADTLSRRMIRPDAVRLMTAHRSKGLEWALVVVAGVQEGLWPDLRRRGSLLEADRIGGTGWPSRCRRARCWPRSGGCSMWRRPARRSGSWSPPSRPPPRTGTSPPVSSPNWASRPPTSPSGRAARCPSPRSSPSCAPPPSTRTPRRPCATPPRAGWRGSRRCAMRRAGRWSRPPTRTAGGGCTSRPTARFRCATGTGPWRCPAARSTSSSTPARSSGSWGAR